METISQTVARLPHEPGIYLFYDKDGTIIYIGKAVDLSRRVKQYFQRDDALGQKTEPLVSQIARIGIIPTTSEFDALLLEAKMVRLHMPKFNSALRDDKSPLYICFTLSEPLPRVIWLRFPQVARYAKNKKNAIYGPFQTPLALRSLLRYIRHAVPYCTQKQRNGKPCFYTHIGLCNPCPSAIRGMTGTAQRKAVLLYRRNIYALKTIFDGRAHAVLLAYEKAMKLRAKTQQFERAAEIKQRRDTLYRIAQQRYDPAIFLERGAEDVYAEELNELVTALRVHYPRLDSMHRIECFDISHLGGTATAGSMVVLEDGKPDSGQYRRFRIKTVRGISDVDSIVEVLERRIAHTEWPPPDFLLIDGGKGQVRAAKNVCSRLGIDIPCAGLAKRNEELIIPLSSGFATIRLPLSGKGIKVAQRIRDEAHRFAITYNRLLRSKRLLTV